MDKKLKIALVQINNSFSGQNYLPYSVAVLQSYIEEHCENTGNYEFLEPVYKREPIYKIVEKLSPAQLVGFSLYVWNANISLETARRLKNNNPNIFIVFGGPQVPNDAEEFLRENPFIDVAIHNEGERKFATLVENFDDLDLSRLNGASFIDSEGKYHRTDDGPRIKDLGEVPSPFLNGVFDKIIENNPEEKWIGLWETNRGCPFRCTFCDWGSATASRLNSFDEERLYKEIEWFSDNKLEYIFCCDANFGLLPRDIDIAKKVAETKHKTGYPTALSVQNTKNATSRAYEAQKILADAGLNKGVALSMQSLDSNTLTAIKRSNIKLDTYFELQRRFTKDRVETYSDLILGLPGETYESFLEGIEALIESGQHNRIQFNNLSILPNAEMGDPGYQKAHGMKTVRSEIINIHGSKEEVEDDVLEWQDLVISTHSTPKEQWVKTRAFCWMTSFLHFNKIMQYPLILAHELSGIPYIRMIEAFLVKADQADRYPLVAKIYSFFEKEAEKIQQGGAEYVYSEEWLGIYWPADEYVYIELVASKQFEEFYEQARDILLTVVADSIAEHVKEALVDAIALNKALVSQPNLPDDIMVNQQFNVMEFCEAIKVGEPIPLSREQKNILVKRSERVYTDFNKWCQEVVWWGNKKGAYLYNQELNNKELSGHY